MLENIGLNLSKKEYTELINILDFNNESINDFIDLCYKIIESPRGKIETYFCNMYATFENPKQIYNSLLECHMFVARNELKNYINEYFTGWYLDDIENFDEIETYFNFMLSDIHDCKDGYIKTSYC